MLLLDLSPEVLMRVLEYVGSDYFLEDVRRLTVSKQWFEFANLVRFKFLNLSAHRLNRLMLSLYVDKNLECINDTTESLFIWLPRDDDLVRETSTSRMAGSSESQEARTARELSPMEMNYDLNSFAEKLKHSRKLRVLHLEAQSLLEHPFTRRWRYLKFTAVQRLLNALHLTTLHLDLFDTYLAPESGIRRAGHLCPSIAALLKNLRCLRLRMSDICPDALIIQPRVSNLKLRELIINLSLSRFSAEAARVAVPSRCDAQDKDFLKLKFDIEEQAKVLVTHMVSPITVRVLAPAFPVLATYSLDVLTGKRMKLGEDPVWDEDGEVVAGSEPESESPISSITDTASPSEG